MLDLVRLLHTFLTIRNCGGVAEPSGGAGPSGGGCRDDEGGGRGGEDQLRSEQLRMKTTPTILVHLRNGILFVPAPSLASQFKPASENRIFGPEQSTNTIVYHTAG